MKKNTLRKWLALMLFVAFSLNSYAEVLQQNFNNAPSWVYDTPSVADGWMYKNFSTSTDVVYYGTTAGYMSKTVYSGDPAGETYILSPEKAGGVGWISFFY
jgi:hypothetical protein